MKCSEKVFLFFKTSFLMVLEQICYLWHHSIFLSFLTLSILISWRNDFYARNSKVSLSQIELYIRNRIKKQAFCENKLFRNIVSYFPPFTLTVTHLSLLLSFLFPKTFFTEDCSIIVLEQICHVLQYRPIFPSFHILGVKTFNLGTWY